MIVLIVGCLIALFIRSTDEEKPLRRPFSWLASRCPKFLQRALFECLECRALWYNAFILSLIAIDDIRYLFYIPVCWVITILSYKYVTA